jgi:hypothetical protein
MASCAEALEGTSVSRYLIGHDHGFEANAALGEKFVASGQVCEGGNLHHPAGIVIVFCFPLFQTVGICSQPIQVVGEPLLDALEFGL